MRRATVLFLLLAFVGVACGKENEVELQTTGGETATPDADSTAAPETTAAPTRAPDGSGGGGPAAGGGDEQPQAPQQPASEGGVNRPKAGAYVYELKGKASDPLNPAAPPRTYPDDAEAYVDISHNGDVTTSERSSSEQTGVFTMRMRWEASRVLLLSFRTDTPIGTFSCAFDPPLVVANIPIKPETFPTQEFKGEGNACDGKVDITVVKQETVNDANGKAWSTWQTKVRIEASSAQFSSTSEDTQWFSPELGVEVRSDGKTNGSFKTQAGTSQNFSGEATTALKKHP